MGWADGTPQEDVGSYTQAQVWGCSPSPAHASGPAWTGLPYLPQSPWAPHGAHPAHCRAAEAEEAACPAGTEPGSSLSTTDAWMPAVSLHLGVRSDWPLAPPSFGHC